MGEALCSAKDANGQYDTVNLDQTKSHNAGFLTRMNWLLNDREIETFGRFPFPMAHSLKMLINKVGMRITLRHAKDNFRYTLRCLHSMSNFNNYRLMYDSTQVDKDPKLKLLDCKIKVVRKDMQEGLMNAYNSQLAMGIPIKYNFNRIESKFS